MTEPSAPSEQARNDASDHLNRLAKPTGALGRLEQIAVWAAGVQGKCPPGPFEQVHVVVVAGDHGVARTAGTSAYPVEVTGQMVAAIMAGGAAVNVLARRVGAHVRVIDASVDSDYTGMDIPPDISVDRIRRSSGSIDRADAMSAEECRQSVATGQTVARDLAAQGADLLIVGDLGIGNTTAAATLTAAMTDGDPVAATGRGTGIDDAAWMRKVAAVRDALWRARHDRNDPEVLLQRVGGPDFGVMVGLLVGAAHAGLPVVLDGVVVTSAALVAEAMSPGTSAWWIAGHRSAEPAHTVALDSLGMTPVLDLSMRLGEGTGALAALPVIEAAIDLLGQMATFESAGVSDRPT